jgi:hypothetical protein
MLKTDPKYGHFHWWPQDDDDWLHREDICLARSMIPGPRIFCREGTQGSYVVMSYGDIRLRVRRTLWQEVAWEGFNVGDWVEVLSLGQRNTPRTGTIREMLWDEHDRCIRYQILENGQPLAKRYMAEDLRHIDPTPPLPTELSHD